MRKTILFSLACIFASFALVSAMKAEKNIPSENKSGFPSVISSKSDTSGISVENARHTAKSASSTLYDSLKLERLGLSFEALQFAYEGYQKLLAKGDLKNTDILTICDFSQSSFKKRMYILDVTNFKVLVNTYVAHGKNTGLQFAKSFSNIPESLQSSLGFYVTRNTYQGKHGLSLKLDGQESGINSKAMERAIVVHGANYIGAHRLKSAFMGRSFGCPAVPQEMAATVINTIKSGSCFFIYHPSENYLNNSKLLNG